MSGTVIAEGEAGVIGIVGKGTATGTGSLAGAREGPSRQVVGRAVLAIVATAAMNRWTSVGGGGIARVGASGAGIRAPARAR
jgi:hypothetical protein